MAEIHQQRRHERGDEPTPAVISPEPHPILWKSWPDESPPLADAAPIYPEVGTFCHISNLVKK